MYLHELGQQGVVVSVEQARGHLQVQLLGPGVFAAPQDREQGAARRPCAANGAWEGVAAAAAAAAACREGEEALQAVEQAPWGGRLGEGSLLLCCCSCCCSWGCGCSWSGKEDEDEDEGEHQEQ